MKKTTLLLSLALATFTYCAQAQDSCPTTVTLTAPLSGGTLVEQASEHLTASNVIQSGNVAYRAGESVTLSAGFEVKPGTVFDASIAACAPVELSLITWEENVFSLGAYPNPFAQNTLIEYTIPETASVSISILDLRGTVISRLLTNEPQSGGTHKITFESETLPNGVYLCTLDTPNGRKTHKIVKQN
ncbi:T9SS type A sorting domain-containing protein [Arundinibacter roseus]|uniref:T9SS type A sorting domain-containing protein n=1 Tax=Arundinibacter roseus TaxID=2070510 RepID=A0A4R4K4U7_9BACT|nr:T9SS type A sorting domain-containing protein [Arundinibacter roseus]TDB61149.1 T9SS type A sorting domain-containing protein [Arundinibacter roseus]